MTDGDVVTGDATAAQESKEMYAKTSANALEDPVYQHTVKQRAYERNAEKEAKESLLQFTRNGTAAAWVLVYAAATKGSRMRVA